MKKANHNHRTEKFSTVETEASVQEHLQRLNETLGTILDPESMLCREYQFQISELSRIFAMQQNERSVHQADQSTSSSDVVREAEKCISECLAGLLQGTQDTNDILSLLRDYRVVRELSERKCCVSLTRIHSILQDNFRGSFLCNFFNMIFGCHPLTESRVIAF